MGLFTRRRPVAEVTWQPEDNDDIEVAPGYAMDDDGCSGENAYGVTFMRDDDPYVSMTIWAYPVAASPDLPDWYQVGYRCEYRVEDDHDAPPWTAGLYEGDVDFYDGLDVADDAAQETARTMAHHGLAGVPDPVAGHFDWDGIPW